MAKMRRCIGSAKFGIEAHEAPTGSFPAQPSQKDGLGRMCKPHWNRYTSALRKAALARRAAEGEARRELRLDQEARATKGSVIDRLTRAANAAGGTVTITPVGACSKTVGKRTCVAGAEGHAGPHDWPKTATAPKPESPRARKAKAVLAATETLGGKTYTDAIGSDEVQAALEGGGQDDTFEQDVRAILAEA